MILDTQILGAVAAAATDIVQPNKRLCRVKNYANNRIAPCIRKFHSNILIITCQSNPMLPPPPSPPALFYLCFSSRLLIYVYTCVRALIGRRKAFFLCEMSRNISQLVVEWHEIYARFLGLSKRYIYIFRWCEEYYTNIESSIAMFVVRFSRFAYSILRESKSAQEKMSFFTSFLINFWFYLFHSLLLLQLRRKPTEMGISAANSVVVSICISHDSNCCNIYMAIGYSLAVYVFYIDKRF